MMKGEGMRGVGLILDELASCDCCNVRPPWGGIDLKYAIGLTHGAQMGAFTIPTYGKEYDSG